MGKKDGGDGHAEATWSSLGGGVIRLQVAAVPNHELVQAGLMFSLPKTGYETRIGARSHQLDDILKKL